MKRPRTRDAVIEAAWSYYAAENPPDTGFSYSSRRLFIAGYLRGRACVMGLAFMYCMLVTIIYTVLLFLV